MKYIITLSIALLSYLGCFAQMEIIQEKDNVRVCIDTISPKTNNYCNLIVQALRNNKYEDLVRCECEFNIFDEDIFEYRQGNDKFYIVEVYETLVGFYCYIIVKDNSTKFYLSEKIPFSDEEFEYCNGSNNGIDRIDEKNMFIEQCILHPNGKTKTLKHKIASDKELYWTE